MIELLRFVAEHLDFLFESGRFRFVDSRVDGGARGSAMLVLESPATRLRLTHHHSEILLDFQSVEVGSDDWFSLGLLRGVLLGDRGGSEVLDSNWARFLRGSLNELETEFGDPARAATLVGRLGGQARQRADALFPRAVE
jgi:hypothetical protein